MAALKACSKLIHNLRDRGARKFHGIDANQALKIVIEIDEAKLDPPVTNARDCHLATTEPKRVQARFEHRATNRVEHQVSALSIRQSFDLDRKLLSLGIYKSV